MYLMYVCRHIYLALYRFGQWDKRRLAEDSQAIFMKDAVDGAVREARGAPHRVLQLGGSVRDRVRHS